MKVLIFGINGWIGGKIRNILEEQEIEYMASICRADNVKDVEKEIIEYHPTHIFSIIGRTHGEGFSTIDYLEQPGKLMENVRDNLYSPISLALLCYKHNIHFTQVSTGCIFEDYSDLPIFDEESEPNFFGSGYSTVKGFTDRLFHQFPFNEVCLNLRIRMPITDENHHRNFITKITSYEKICSIPNSMTVLPELLPIMVELAKNKHIGTINFTNPGSISHNEILEMYKEIVDPDFKWKNFSLEEQNSILASGRSNNHLNTTKLETLYPNVLPIKESVRKILIKMKFNYSNPFKIQ